MLGGIRALSFRSRSGESLGYSDPPIFGFFVRGSSFAPVVQPWSTRETLEQAQAVQAPMNLAACPECRPRPMNYQVRVLIKFGPS